MAKELVFLLSAELDIQEAFEFYEWCQPARGEFFMRHLDVAVGQISDFPESAPAVNAKYRRLLISGFPYGIFYSMEGNRIIVAGVLDLRRDPSVLRERFGAPDPGAREE